MSAVLPSDAAGSPDAFSPPRCAADAGSRRMAFGTIAVAAAALAQGAALAIADGSSAAEVLIAIAVAAACAVAWTQRSRVRHADVVIATAAFGGLGMMIGGWIAAAMGGMHDRSIASAGAMDHGMMHGGWIARAASGIGHGMSDGAHPFVATGVMVLACVAACEWTCTPLCRGTWMRRLAMHAVVAAAMVVGMWAAGAMLGQLGAPHGAAAVHAAMVMGMAIGAAVALRGVDGLASAVRGVEWLEASRGA